MALRTKVERRRPQIVAGFGGDGSCGAAPAYAKDGGVGYPPYGEWACGVCTTSMPSGVPTKILDSFGVRSMMKANGCPGRNDRFTLSSQSQKLDHGRNLG